MNRPRFFVAIGVGALLLTSGMFVYAQQGKSKGELKMIEGEAVDIYCHVVRGFNAEQMAGCAERNLGRKLPVGIVEAETGDLYVAAFRRRRPANVWPTWANPELGPLLGMKVSAQGTVFEKNGLKFIEIHAISEAWDEEAEE